MDFDMGGLSGAQNKPMTTKIRDLDKGKLAMASSGLKTGPGQNFDVSGLALLRPGVKTNTGMQNKPILTQAGLLWWARFKTSNGWRN